MLAPRSSLLTPWLRRYFYSGWAFLMPYLFAYLLYYATKWPVNAAGAAAAAAGNGSEVIGDGAIASTAHNLSPIASHLGSIPIPCLLHLYWMLHAIHAVLAGVALWTWVRGQRAVISDKCSEVVTAYALPLKPYNSPGAPSALTPYPLNLITRAIPWALLALLFYIPGVYLEWPSDPWEHLRRINEWRVLDTVGAHSSWLKSSYFIPYSFLSWCIGLRQLFWLDFYYTGICLLLCWQYYRFSRACGLGERSSMVFVIIQALLFGNNIFSFYRYYGISSSIYAQLGAIALTRIVLEFASRGTKRQLDLSLRGRGAVTQPDHVSQSASPIAPHPSPTPAPPLAPGLRPLASGFWHLPSLFWLLTPISCLIALTALNHPQGLGIAALGIAAVLLWRLIEWKRSALWWMIGGTIIINALFLWLYHRPAIIETYRAQGWLNAWSGFNILDLTSPAGDRMVQILSAFGLVNLIAAIVLVRHNQVIAWVTIIPLLALLLPCVSIPLINALSDHGNNTINIITFQRMLFSVPLGLAAVCLGQRVIYEPETSSILNKRSRCVLFGMPITYLTFAAFMATPSTRYYYNRVWQTNAIVPKDLLLMDVFSQYEAVKGSAPDSQIVTNQAGTPLLAYSSNLIGTGQVRTIGTPCIDSITAALDFLGVNLDTNSKALIPSVGTISKPNSTGYLNLISDPKASNAAAWVTLDGHAPEFVNNIADLASTRTALQNPVGFSSEVFTSAMIPIVGLKSYRIEMTARKARSNNGIAYLAVAWYDAHGKPLYSNVSRPEGAGNPHGWGNGIYSYFGLVAQTPPTNWTTYRISFGLGEEASIPPLARFVRIGAQLNYTASPSAIVQVTDIELREKPTTAIGLVTPKVTNAYSAVSQASLLSNHWPATQVMVDRGGSAEIQEAAKRIGKTCEIVQ